MNLSLIRRAAVSLVAAAACLALAKPASADVLDCRTGCNGTGGFLGTAIFTTTNFGSSGTGVIDSFVRLQADGSESGHNTSGATINDEKGGGFTTDLQIAQVPVTIINGLQYYEFLLDINQTGDSWIALNNIQLCTASTGGQVTSATCPGTLKYSMGAFGSGADFILMDNGYAGSGSGKADLFMYIPTSTLGTNPNTYIYLFSQFGVATPQGIYQPADKKDVLGDTNDGFEEWAVQRCYPNCAAVPEPTPLVLLGTGLIGMALLVRRFRQA